MKLKEDEITPDDVAREAVLMRIFGSYETYVETLPRSIWTKGDNGLWVGKSR